MFNLYALLNDYPQLYSKEAIPLTGKTQKDQAADPFETQCLTRDVRILDVW